MSRASTAFRRCPFHAAPFVESQHQGAAVAFHRRPPSFHFAWYARETKRGKEDKNIEETNGEQDNAGGGELWQRWS